MIVRLVEPADRWSGLWASFERALRADSRITSKRTIEVYREGGRQFREFLINLGHDTDPLKIDKPVIEEWLIHLREEKDASPATVRARFAALRRFFRWLEAEEEIPRSPMDRMPSPRVDEVEASILTDDEVRRLLHACEGRTFDDRRDMAIIRLALDIGLRRFEIAGMRNDPSILEDNSVEVVGKGSRKAHH